MLAVQVLGIEPRTPGLSCQCSPTELKNWTTNTPHIYCIGVQLRHSSVQLRHSGVHLRHSGVQLRHSGVQLREKSHDAIITSMWKNTSPT